MKPTPSSEHDDEHDERDRDVIELLKDLGRLQAAYPPELLAASRAAFLAGVEQLLPGESDEELSPADLEIVQLLGGLKSAQDAYPPQLLTARRAAFLRQMKNAEPARPWDRLAAALRNRVLSRATVPRLMRISFGAASLLAALVLGSLFLSSGEGAPPPSPSAAAAAPTVLLPAGTVEVALTICSRYEPSSACLPGELDPGEDLADPRNGPARPAVSKDARYSEEAVNTAAYVNDGRGGASWVSDSPGSWVKIDLGEVRTIDTVSLQMGETRVAREAGPGQFVIAVARSDLYADGHSRDDDLEYAEVFHSERTGFSGAISHAELLRTQFPPVRARFVKITFEKAGAAIEEIDVFLAGPPALAERPRSTPTSSLPGRTATVTSSSTPVLAANATSVLSTDTAAASPTETLPPAGSPTPLPTETEGPSSTPLPLPTDTPAPADTAAPPTDLPPSNTPPPPPTAVPPTAVPATEIAATVPPSPVSPATIVLTGNEQTVTLTCNDAAVEVRGHANSVTLLGSCSSITVSGNGNRVFWESGSPVITDRGTGNVISQL